MAWCEREIRNLHRRRAEIHEALNAKVDWAHRQVFWFTAIISFTLFIAGVIFLYDGTGEASITFAAALFYYAGIMTGMLLVKVLLQWRS